MNSYLRGLNNNWKEETATIKDSKTATLDDGTLLRVSEPITSDIVKVGDLVTLYCDPDLIGIIIKCDCEHRDYRVLLLNNTEKSPNSAGNIDSTWLQMRYKVISEA